MAKTARGALRASKARSEGLVVQELDGEVLVYDLDRHRAHCLNPAAARVWRNCDGSRTVAELADMLNHEMKAPLREQVVINTLEDLAARRLLQEQRGELGDAGVSRRQMIRKMAIGVGVAAGAGLALPLITSIVVPTPAEAGSRCRFPG